MNQHTWVRECTNYYEENGLNPGDPNDGDWDECHYPDPESVGEETIWMLHGHHQPQGIWQSEEYNRQCFFSGDAKKFLKEGPFVPGWFELWDLYDKWSGYNGRNFPVELRSEIGKQTAKANFEQLIYI